MVWQGDKEYCPLFHDDPVNLLAEVEATGSRVGDVAEDLLRKASEELTRLRAVKRHPLVTFWRLKSADALIEAKRIRDTVKGPSDAEQRCRTRAEVWEWCANELENASATE
jgi:hypothetical protein